MFVVSEIIDRNDCLKTRLIPIEGGEEPLMPDAPDLLPRREIAPEDIPRCPELDGSTLKIMPSFAEGEPTAIAVTDGERTAIYVPLLRDTAVVTAAFDRLRIARGYTEAGWYAEANVLQITDGKRTAVYVPLRKVERSK